MMPPFLIGRLQQELPGQYILSHVLEPEEDHNDPRGFRIAERTTFDVVNRTYVWRVEMLGAKPDISGEPENLYDYGGGLG